MINIMTETVFEVINPLLITETSKQREFLTSQIQYDHMAMSYGHIVIMSYGELQRCMVMIIHFKTDDH